jgi:transposase
METILTKKELYQLRQDLRNKTKLHEAARARVTHLEETVQTQKLEIIELKVAREKDHALILELKRQLEELRTKLFGKRKKQSADMSKDDEEEQHNDKDENGAELKKRGARPIPSAHSVTTTKRHLFTTHQCTTCSSELNALQTVDYYVEDIVLPHEQQLTTVTQTSIERGWCSKCRRFRHAKPPPSAQVMLGKNVKVYICYLSIILRLSYEQIRTHLNISYALHISDGEVSHILTKEAIRLRPEYEAVSERIDQQSGVHEDETPWKVQRAERGTYGWVKTGTETNEAVFRFGESRGGGVARELTGTYAGVGITDDYAVYHSIFGEKHQLCWSKPHRKLRDLARSKVFTGEIHEHCKETYHRFSSIYATLRETRADEWDAERNKHARTVLMEKLRSFAEPDARDPKAMACVKTRLRKVTAKYFTCLLYEGIPDTNNKAERALRHMVIKRRTCFGSKTQKGAETISVLASVMLSLYWTKPETFWQDYMAVRG